MRTKTNPDKFAVTRRDDYFHEFAESDDDGYTFPHLERKGRVIGMQETGFECRDVLFNQIHGFRTEVRVADMENPIVSTCTQTNRDTEDRFLEQFPCGYSKLAGHLTPEYAESKCRENPHMARVYLYNQYFNWGINRRPAIKLCPTFEDSAIGWESDDRKTRDALRSIFSEMVKSVLAYKYTEEEVRNLESEDLESWEREMINSGERVIRNIPIKRFELVSHKSPEEAVEAMTGRYHYIVSQWQRRIISKHAKRKSRKKISARQP